MEAVYKIKPAAFTPNRESRLALLIASVLFSAGCAMVIAGFKLTLQVLWVPGYSLAVIAFILYASVILYGPLDIKPGALIVAFPDDTVAPRPAQTWGAQADETTQMNGYDTREGTGTTTAARSVASRGEGAYAPRYRENPEAYGWYGDYRGYAGFRKYENCPKGYTPKSTRPGESSRASLVPGERKPYRK